MTSLSKEPSQLVVMDFFKKELRRTIKRNAKRDEELSKLLNTWDSPNSDDTFSCNNSNCYICFIEEMKHSNLAAIERDEMEDLN